MQRTAAAILSISLIAACGDSPAAPDAAESPDATAAEIDALVCEAPAAYPETVAIVTVELGATHSLSLDGVGERCEQIVRALLDPETQPPALAQLDGTGAEGTCTHDDVLDREIVRVRVREYAGVPLFGMVQDVLAHVDAADDVVYLAGNYIPSGHAPPTACLDTAAVTATVPGEALGYTRFAACTPQGEGSYAIAADDEIEVGEEGVHVDFNTGVLRRVRAVDVYLLEDHVTDETINSNLYCCDGSTGVAHCVGARLFVDVLTGAVVGDEGHCITC